MGRRFVMLALPDDAAFAYADAKLVGGSEPTTKRTIANFFIPASRLQPGWCRPSWLEDKSPDNLRIYRRHRSTIPQFIGPG